MTMRAAPAELVERREILPGRWVETYRAPDIANGARAGQFVHVRTDDGNGMIRRRPVPLGTTDAATGTVSLHVPPDDRRGSRGAPRPGEPADLFGPAGRPFEVDPRSRHLLLIAEGTGIGALRMLADEAVRDGREVTLLLGASSARDVYPSRLLPDEVEYVVATADGSLGHAGSVVDLVPDYEAWADQAFAAGPWPMLVALAGIAAGRQGRLGVARLGRKRGSGKAVPAGSTLARRRAFLQVVVDQVVGCATATCLGCVVPGAGGGLLRACREGPVFGSDQLDWNAAP